MLQAFKPLDERATPTPRAPRAPRGPRLPSQFDALCSICRKQDPNVDALYDACNSNSRQVICSGSCYRAFHRACIPSPDISTDVYKCDVCTSLVFPCFCCGSSDDSVTQCRSPGCGKRYHVDCAERVPRFEVGHMCIHLDVSHSTRCSPRMARWTRSYVLITHAPTATSGQYPAHP